MAKKYGLQVILEQKKWSKLQALKELAKVMLTLQEHRDLLDKLVKEMLTLESIVELKLDSFCSAISEANMQVRMIVGSIGFIEILKQKINKKNLEIVSQNYKIAKIEYEVEQKRHDVMQAMVELEKINIHHRKWELNRNRFLNQKEMKMLQDIYVSYPQKGFFKHDQTY